MVVLTIDAPKKERTVYFDEHIPKPRLVSLLSCSLYNTRHNLKGLGFMSYETFDGGSLVSGPVSPGNYNIDTLADYLTKSKIVLTEKKPLK